MEVDRAEEVRKEELETLTEKFKQVLGRDDLTAVRKRELSSEDEDVDDAEKRAGPVLVLGHDPDATRCVVAVATPADPLDVVDAVPLERGGTGVDS